MVELSYKFRVEWIQPIFQEIQLSYFDIWHISPSSKPSSLNQQVKFAKQ